MTSAGGFRRRRLPDPGWAFSFASPRGAPGGAEAGPPRHTLERAIFFEVKRIIVGQDLRSGCRRPAVQQVCVWRAFLCGQDVMVEDLARVVGGTLRIQLHPGSVPD